MLLASLLYFLALQVAAGQSAAALLRSTSPRVESSQPTSQIRLNQIGFYPDAPKAAVVVDPPADSFYVLTSDAGDTVLTGTLGPSRTWPAAGETVRIADFSDITSPGEFVISVPDLGSSYPFEIVPAVHQNVARAALKAFNFQRASTALDAEYAKEWARSAGHPDDEVIVHPSAASEGRPSGTIISAPKGWYDAGDYNKYIVNSGISVGTLLMLFEHYPDYFSALESGIPESGNAVPDILDEALWNIRWMLTMQDPGDGGVYHKLTAPTFEGAVMPGEAKKPRYVVQKSTAATLDFASVMAIGARIYDDFADDLPGLADSMLAAARHAWDWAAIHPDVTYDQQELNARFEPDITTGAYGNGNVDDEFRWAAAELFITTNADSFVAEYPPLSEEDLEAPSWPDVGSLAYISLAHHRESVSDDVDIPEVIERLISLSDTYVDAMHESAYGMVMGAEEDFFWGSNSLAGNQGIVLMQAFRLTGDDRYLHAALTNLDYLLGRNGVGYSFVTGWGDRTPMHIHHRQSQSDQVEHPVPGLLVGGPNPGRQDDCTYPSTLPAKAYLDSYCSYASNEIAINWNAPLAYLAGAIEATISPTGLPIPAEP